MLLITLPTTRRNLRQEINKALQNKGITLKELSEITEISLYHLNNLFNNNQNMKITELDIITSAIDCNEGWLYDAYISECFKSTGGVDELNLYAYLLRCVDLNLTSCVEVALKELTNKSNISIIYKIAEDLYAQGKIQESIVFFETVIENENNNISELFVMSQYRLFRARIGTDLVKNREALAQFRPYRSKLLINYQLDALLNLAEISFTLHNYDEMETYADELREIASATYRITQHDFYKYGKYAPIETEQHLILYYGQSYLIKMFALRNKEKYEEAKQYLEGYSNIEWFNEHDENAKIIADKFRKWAAAGAIELELFQGNFEVISKAELFIEENPDDLLTLLCIALEMAIKYDKEIDVFVAKHSKYITQGSYTQMVHSERLMRFHFALATYNLKRNKVKDAYESALQSARNAIKLRSEATLLKCVALLHKYSAEATPNQLSEFSNIIEEVL